MPTPKRPDTLGLPIERFPSADQKRLDELMSRHNDGRLAPEELVELKELVRRTEELALRNAQRIDAARRQRPASDGNGSEAQETSPRQPKPR
jgi:hypothetical protein